VSYELLEDASDRLRAAAEATDEATQRRLHGQSDALTAFAARERGAGHGRLARHIHALAELAEEAEGAVQEAVVDARSTLSTFRENVDGV